MKQILKITTLAPVLLVLSFISVAQKKWLQVGDQLPDIQLNDILNYPGGHARISDFRGKLLIIDCWSTGCSSCIAAFPRMEKLQEQFKDRIQIITLTKTPKEDVDDFFAGRTVIKARGRMSLLPSLLGDTAISGLFRPYLSVPEHIWIDANGKVLYITHAYNATVTHIQAVLDGARPFMLEKHDVPRETLSGRSLASYVHDEMPGRVKYSSFFTGYSTDMSSLYSVSKHVDSVNQLFRADYMNYSPIQLICTAFMAGRSSFEDNFQNPNRVEWKTDNWSDLIQPKDYDSLDLWTVRRVCSYEQLIPMKEMPGRYRLMQEDVNRYYRGELGVEAKVVTIRKKCLVLVQGGQGIRALRTTTADQPAQELSSKTGELPEWRRYINMPFKNVVEGLYYDYDLVLKQQPYPFIDETNFTGNADLKYDMSATSVAGLNKQLAHYGLKLIYADRWIKMLQIEKVKDYAKR